jgi:hypothetical protein
MHYDRNRVEVLNIIEGYGHISFIEFREKSSGRVRILSHKNFLQRVGVEAG